VEVEVRSDWNSDGVRSSANACGAGGDAVDDNRLNEIVLGKRGITADTALRLSRFLKTSPQMWMHLQADWDLQRAVRRAARKAS
jgi:addiction module HigA family antidote